MSHVMCHVSCVIYHVYQVMSNILILFKNWWNFRVEGMLATWPTPSSLSYSLQEKLPPPLGPFVYLPDHYFSSQSPAPFPPAPAPPL